MADDNWLDAAVIECPACGMQLFRAIHSPFCDDDRLYCDRCPRAIEISYYDSNYGRILADLGPAYTREQIMAAVEPLLKSCVCGGRFRDKSPRRCFACGAIVPDAARHDLSPYIGCEDSDRDATAEEQAKYQKFETAFIGRGDVWAQACSTNEARSS